MRSSGGRSVQSRGAVMDMARLENLRCIHIATGGRETVSRRESGLDGWRKVLEGKLAGSIAANCR